MTDRGECTMPRKRERDPAIPEVNVEVRIDPAVRQRLDSGRLVQLARRAVEYLGRHVGSMDILIVDDRCMREMHARHLGEAETTDVISFNLAGTNEPIEMQLIICADAAEREALARSISLEQELLLYAIHGLLHCAG